MAEPIPNAYPTRRLPPQPNLEHLLAQAKDLLERFCAAEPEALSEVRHFERQPDPSAFALHDAQRILAHAYGYRSWSSLTAFVHGVNVHELAEAVQAGDMSKVRTILHSRPDLIGRDLAENNEHRALHFAVLRRDPAMVRLLMEAGADARKGIFPHRDATSPLALARDRDYIEIVAIIEDEERRRREDLSCPNATVSPLQDQINAAIAQGDNQLAIRLLNEDASFVHSCDRTGANPLHIAAAEANQEMVAWLLHRRANPNKRDIHDRTPLDRAALSDDPQSFPCIARLLLDAGAHLTLSAAVALQDAASVRAFVQADPDSLRRTSRNGGLLTLAVHHGHIGMVQLLLDLGADVDERVLLEELEAPTPSWGMPLWSAALANQYAIAELLLDRGADPNANVYASGWPLRNAWSHQDGRLKKLLLERGATPQPYMLSESHDIDGASRLLASDTSEELAQELAWSAADHGCPAILELALPHLPWPLHDPRWHWIIIQPIRGATADHASRQGHFTCMQVLLSHGIDPDISRYGQTALHFTAAYRGDVSDEDRCRFAGLLIDHGASLSVRDDLLKSTPLGWAIRWRREKLAQLLIDRGAPINEPDAEPWATPKAWASKFGR